VTNIYQGSYIQLHAESFEQPCFTVANCFIDKPLILASCSISQDQRSLTISINKILKNDAFFLNVDEIIGTLQSELYEVLAVYPFLVSWESAILHYDDLSEYAQKEVDRKVSARSRERTSQRLCLRAGRATSRVGRASLRPNMVGSLAPRVPAKLHQVML